MKKYNIIAINLQTIEIIIKLHSFFGDTSKVLTWLTTENFNLGGLSPCHLIYYGKSDKVLSFITTALDENIPERFIK